MPLQFEIENNTQFDEAIKSKLYVENGKAMIREGEWDNVADLMMQKYGVISINDSGEVTVHQHALKPLK